MKKILLASIASAAAFRAIASADAADLGLRPMYAAPRLLHGPGATSEATSVVAGDAKPSLSPISVKQREFRN